jgi:hypothetical protein
MEAVSNRRDFDPMLYRVVGGVQEENTQWWVSKLAGISGQIRI